MRKDVKQVYIPVEVYNRLKAIVDNEFPPVKVNARIGSVLARYNKEKENEVENG